MLGFELEFPAGGGLIAVEVVVLVGDVGVAGVALPEDVCKKDGIKRDCKDFLSLTIFASNFELEAVDGRLFLDGDREDDPGALVLLFLFCEFDEALLYKRESDCARVKRGELSSSTAS